MGTRSQKAAVNLLMLSKHINTFNTGKMFCFVFLAATSCSIPPSVFWSAGPQKSPHPLAAGQVSLQRFVCIHVKWLQQWCIPGTCMTSYTCTILLGHDTKDCWLMVGAVLGVAFSNKAWILDLMHWGRKQLHVSWQTAVFGYMQQHVDAIYGNLHLFSECWKIYSTVTTKQSPPRLNVRVQKPIDTKFWAKG